MNTDHLNCERRNIDGREVLFVSGEIDVYSTPLFRKAIEELLLIGQKDIIINMGGLTYMDSSGFGALLAATKKLRPLGGSVNLVQCSATVERILKITKLDTVFAVYDSMENALSAINAR